MSFLICKLPVLYLKMVLNWLSGLLPGGQAGASTSRRNDECALPACSVILRDCAERLRPNVQREQLEVTAFSGKWFLNLPLRSYQKVHHNVASSWAQFLLRSLHRD